MILHIRKSKTDQLGTGQHVRINSTEEEHCPVELTRLYIIKLRYGTENGFLQPQVRTYKDGSQSGVWFKKLNYSTALEDTKAFMALIGRDPSDYGEHSGRRGGATAASEAGVSWLDLKRHGRWASDSAPQRYIEQTQKRANKVAAALAGGPPKKARSTVTENAPAEKEVPPRPEPPKEIWNEAQRWAMEQRKSFAENDRQRSFMPRKLSFSRCAERTEPARFKTATTLVRTYTTETLNNNKFVAPRRIEKRVTQPTDALSPNTLKRLFEEEFFTG